MDKFLGALMALVIGASSVNTVPDKDFLHTGSNTQLRIYYNASSNYSVNHKGINAIDDDPKTIWLSEKSDGPHWLEIDLGIKRLMTTLVIYPGKKDEERTIKNFVLQFKYNDEWFDFREVRVEDKASSIFGGTRTVYRDRIEINLGGVDASIFRIMVPAGATYDGYAAISEIEMFIGTARIQYFDRRLKGLCFPIVNGFLPPNDASYPNAPRSYRGGRHAGLDVYTWHNGKDFLEKPVTYETKIVSVADGVVIRADWNYKPLSPEAWHRESAYLQNHPHTFDMHSFGGRQVWIDHRNGVISAYNHMSAIEEGIVVGAEVERGEVIGRAGNSGLLGEAEGNQKGTHLHFELWVDGFYFGYGMEIEQIKTYIKWMFFQTQ